MLTRMAATAILPMIVRCAGRVRENIEAIKRILIGVQGSKLDHRVRGRSRSWSSLGSGADDITV